jgi:hypothetical protein
MVRRAKMKRSGLLVMAAVCGGCALGTRSVQMDVEVPRLASTVEKERVAAAEAIARSGRANEALDALLRAANDVSPAVRAAAVWALYHASGPARDAALAWDTPATLVRRPPPVALESQEYVTRLGGPEGVAYIDPGLLFVRVLVDESGDVRYAEMAKETTTNLKEVALDVAKDYQFLPAKRGGRPVPSVQSVPVTFSPAQ